MANLTSVTLTAGVPTAGTGTVSTLDALLAIMATAAKQDTGNTALAGLLTNLADPATQATLADILALLTAGIDTTITNANANITVVSGGTVAAGTAGAPVVGADQYAGYETVAASQTAQALGATGATGDYLAYVTVFPGLAGCGVVTILDNSTTWGTFAGGGTTALPSLVPFRIDVGAFSKSGAWKITTGANVTAAGVGKFT